MLFPTLSHTLGRLHRLHRALERERRLSANGTRLLRLQALLLQAKARLAVSLAPEPVAYVPVRIGTPRHVR